MTKVFLLIPTLKNDGAIKGAVAMANGLSQYFDVTLVVLKKILDHRILIDPNVKIISLGSSSFWLIKYIKYKAILKESNESRKLVSISFCFSADVVNLLSRKNAISYASLRASIPFTYVSTYGWLGNILAKCHIYVLNRIGRVISMSESMSKKLQKLNVNGIVQVGNFIDEKSLIKEKIQYKNTGKKDKRFVFLGSLIKRKRVDLLIEVVRQLKTQGKILKLDLIGEGPLEQELKNKVRNLDLSNEIEFYGHKSNPYSILQRADYFLLPSEAEGVSRASLEALFFGIPCILRDIDANNELIIPGENGYLFNKDKELISLLEKISNSENINLERKNLIPSFFRQEKSINKLVQLINNVT